MQDNTIELIKFTKTLRVLVVEDNQEARQQVIKLLENLFDYLTIGVDGVDGLKKFKTQKFDLVITDINMPNMNGIEMIREIKKSHKDIPIIILSAYNDTEHFMDTIELGIDGYILKPINLNQFIETLNKTIQKIKLIDENNRYKQELENLNGMLEIQVNERIIEIISLNKEIKDTQKEVIFTMGAIGERRSKETGKHVKRVAEYSKLLALLYGLESEKAEMLKQASPMHDIGKVAIPDTILNKPTALNIEEREIMNTHATLGYEMLNGSKRALLKLASIVAHQHHEKWDGTGYPQGLIGTDIDICGRITALADVFDALCNNRVYKKAWDDEEIFRLFKDQRGKHFDPELVDIFFDNLDDFLNIRENLKDD